MAEKSVEKNEDWENIENIFNKLKESPLYNLSMSSLENFHTNFLVWLGNTYPKETLELLNSVLLKEEQIEIKNYDDIKFFSQENCGKNCIFDLCVKENNNIILVLENKIKSYPTEEQLEKYNEGIRNSNCKKILLTLFPCNLELEKLEWKSVKYSDFLNENNPFMSNLQIPSYHKKLIKDYFNLIKNLDIITEYDKNIAHTKYDMYDISKKFEAINFKNIYIKYRTFELMNFIKKHVINNQNDTKNIKFSTDFSNSNEGVINIEKKYIIDKTNHNNKKDNYDFILSIQIQGSQYRYCLVCLDDKQENNKKRFDFAESLKGEGYWFNNTENKYTIRKNNPYQEFFKNSENINQYLSYKPDRIYRYTKIEANIPYESIAEKVLDDIKTLNNKEKEQKIIACYNEIIFP